MKRGAPEHPKTVDLYRQLGIPKYGAVGILELLWHFTAKYAPQGDVGRFSDGQLAEAVTWPGDPAKLVHALVETGWLDRSRTHRLLVHDWLHHSDDTTKKYLSRNHLAFAEPDRTKSRQGLVKVHLPGEISPDCGATAVASAVAVARALPLPMPNQPAARIVADFCEVFRSRVEPSKTNIAGAQRALEAGHTVEEMRRVFEAVRDGTTETAIWCRAKKREFLYLTRPAYRRHSDGQLISGPAEKILNELGPASQPPVTPQQLTPEYREGERAAEQERLALVDRLRAERKAG